MNKAEWQIYHGFNDEEMERITVVIKLFNGKITKILDKPIRSDIIKSASERRKLNVRPYSS